MRAFLLVTCLVVAAVARPEAGYPYNGLQQQQLSQNSLPLKAHPAQPHVYQQLPQQQNFANFVVPAPQMIYLPPQEQLQAEPAVEQSNAAAAAPLATNYEDSYNMAHRLSASPHASGYNNGPVETKVHKHIYVHVPPKDFEEEDAVQPRVHHQVGPKQKHYKIVFIKAPAAPAVRAPIVAPPSQQEEKTLIYVLHKKPEQEQDIIIPTPAPTKPSKPEVYFIKYKTKKEEAPVYGPPPATLADREPRQGATAEDFASLNVGDIQPATTVETTNENMREQQHQQLLPEVPVPSSLYGAPTAASYTGEEVQTTLAAPSSQYLQPSIATTSATDEKSMAPIIVNEEEQLQQNKQQQQQQQQPTARVPSSNYGPPTRYYIKKRK